MTSSFPKDYSEPVLALISLGEAAVRAAGWLDYTELGISALHIPDLLKILAQVEEFWPDDALENAPETYAPIHAWRALAQLKTEQAIPVLIDLVIWNEDQDMDWIMEEVPEVLGMIGPSCIPPLRGYLLDPGKQTWASVTLAHGLAEVGKQHPESRLSCVEALQTSLVSYLTNDETINAFLISCLADLKAVEAVDLVERAFQADVVDISVMGDFEDFQIEIGLLEERLTPPPSYRWARDPESAWKADQNALIEANRRQREQEKKEKKKQKQAKKARKGKKHR